jgi:fructose-bisphosphate aldolase class 1
MTNGPASKGLPDNVTVWYEWAGMVTEMGFVSNVAPEVLRDSHEFADAAEEIKRGLPEAQALNLEIEYEGVV